MTRISSQKTRRAILATDLAWDPTIIPDRLVLYDSLGNIIDLEHVQGPQGPPGPPGGGDVISLASQPVLDVGIAGQIRAGRQLTATDFTDMGLSAPLGLWNLSDVTDASGNGRHLINKGAVAFDKGVNGLATTAARFIGSAAQGLYITDTGVNDAFKIRNGTFGCWFKTPKRATGQVLISKLKSGTPSLGYMLQTSTDNTVTMFLSFDGSSWGLTLSSTIDICDNRWHLVVGTYNGTNGALYIDGQLETIRSGSLFGYIFASNGPLNIGSYDADAGTNGVAPSFGRADEAFVTSDVLTEDQIRNLYCAKIPHILGTTPIRASLNVRRRRRGGVLIPADFPIAPVRLYNFTGGSLADEGLSAVAVVNNGAGSAAGADGLAAGSFNYAGGQSLSSTDAGLPAGLATRSFGCWFKTVSATGYMVTIGWGTVPSAHVALMVGLGNLIIQSGSDNANGPFVADGLWHHIVVVEDNAASEGVRRKVYLDGRLVAISTVMNPITLAGANRFRIGSQADGTGFFNGQIDGVFVVPGALASEDVYALYAKGGQSLGVSPKNTGDHVEQLAVTHILATFDTLESSAQVDLGVGV